MKVKIRPEDTKKYGVELWTESHEKRLKTWYNKERVD
jgi:hypothetical protein